MSSRILEHKRNYNKNDQRFECERLYGDESLVALRYVTDSDYSVAGRPIPKGSSTLGLYHRGETYVFWMMLSPGGSIQGYLFHICEPVEILTDQVRYRDLMLDIWQSPGGSPELLDEDELAEALRDGLIAPDAAALAYQTANALLARIDEVIHRERSLLANYIPSC